ncbi:MAG: S8 family serine peptidase, partial [Methyloligellaceae bacterium]
MFKPNTARLPEGRDRGSIAEAVLPARIKRFLQQARAEEMAKGLPRFKQADTLRVLKDGRIYKTPDYSNLFVIRLPEGAARQAVIDSLKKHPSVAIVEKDQPVIFRGVDPNDPNFNLQWNLKNTGQFGGTPGADVKATDAWTITTGSNSVILGIIDLGVQGSHPDFENASGQSRVSGDSQFITDHGTAVAGVAAATGNNAIGVAGVDWNAAIHAEQVNGFTIGNVPAIIDAIDDAVTAGARVLNNSWGHEQFSQLLFNQFVAAYQADVLPVDANPETGGEGDFPNDYGSWILNVAATTNGDAQAAYSFSRDFTDVAAPGGNNDQDARHNIYTTRRTAAGSYGYQVGTSYAAPHVTGIAGLLLSLNPNLRNYDLEWIVKRSANDIDPPGPDNDTGYGRVNAYEAVRHVSSP